MLTILRGCRTLAKALELFRKFLVGTFQPVLAEGSDNLKQFLNGLIYTCRGLRKFSVAFRGL